LKENSSNETIVVLKIHDRICATLYILSCICKQNLYLKPVQEVRTTFP